MIDYTVSPVPLSYVRDFIENNHYSKSVNGCKVTQCYALYDDVYLIGAILFGELSTTAWKKYGDSEKDVIELRRLCTLDTCAKNTESWFISRALKHLKSIYPYKVCISYADPYHNHVGYVYQASNWAYLGTTNKDKLLKSPDGRLYHSRALRTKYKGKYKPFVLKLRELYDNGLLEEIEVPGKHIYLYNLKGKQIITDQKYPKNHKYQ